MRRVALLCVLLVGLVGIAAPTITPTPWRYGVIYWVGGPPQHPEAYVNMATNWVERVFRFWGLPPGSPAERGLGHPGSGGSPQSS